MAKNEGKKFEEDIKKSVPKECWVYRFRDSSGAWGDSSNTRFTPSNICDYMIMARINLFLLELKSHKGASIPFNAIRPKQITELSGIEHENIKPYFIFNFRDLEKTYALKAKDVADYIESADRKSIPVTWCIEKGIEIPQKKKKVTWIYDLRELLEHE